MFVIGQPLTIPYQLIGWFNDYLIVVLGFGEGYAFLATAFNMFKQFSRIGSRVGMPSGWFLETGVTGIARICFLIFIRRISISEIVQSRYLNLKPV